MRYYQECVTTGQKDPRQSKLYVPLCFAGDTKRDFSYDRYPILKSYCIKNIYHMRISGIETS